MKSDWTTNPDERAGALGTRVSEGATFEYLPFFGHRARPGQPIGPWVLSQWWHAPFQIEGIIYPTAEHWMMCSKAMVFGDAESRDRILAITDPSRVKKIGRQIRGFDEMTWQTRRFDMVMTGNVAKFSQHPDLCRYLLGTGEQVLVEVNPHDPVWGVALGIGDPRVRQPQHWQGLNLLGFALMQVRDIVRSNIP